MGYAKMKKILFCQSFSLQQPGGGAAILKNLILQAFRNGFETQVCFDKKEVPNEYLSLAYQNKEVGIDTKERHSNINHRLNFLVLWLIVLGVDRQAKKDLKKLFTIFQPDVIHITAHGLTFPLFFFAARKWKKSKIVISIHDVWTETIYHYIPSILSNWVFKKCLSGSDFCYVISEEMGIYIKEKYGVGNYTIIHDGYENPGELALASAKKHMNTFLYVGLMIDEQYRLLQKLISVMGESDHLFEIGICSTKSVVVEDSSSNVVINNYGWVDQSTLIQLSKNYAYGLLPTSFEESKDLFYKTSLMTKVPFYLRVGLPIFAIGKEYYASIKLINQERIGICCTSEDGEHIKESLKKVINLDDNTYVDYCIRVQEVLVNKYNINLIAEKFYGPLY